MEDIPEYEEYQSKYHYFDVADEGIPVIINSVPYVKLREVTENCPFEFSYENGTAYVDTKSSNGVLEIRADANELVKNGQKINVNYPAVEIDDSIYVNAEILSQINIKLNGIYYDPQENTTCADCCYEDPDFVEGLKES